MEFHLFLYFVIWILGRVKIPSKGCSYNNPRKQDGIIWLSHYFTKDWIPSRCKLDTSFSQMGRVKISSKGCTYNNPRTQDGIIILIILQKMEFHLFLYVVNWILLFLRWKESKFHLKAAHTITQEHNLLLVIVWTALRWNFDSFYLR